MERGPAPAALAKAADWTAQYVEGAEFHWHTVEGRPVNHHLRDALALCTDGHCSYCDAGDLGASSRPTIDHFRPKGRTRFPHLAFQWENLFLACDACQSHKLELFEEPLLKADAPDMNFDRYFEYDSFSGLIEPNPGASPEDQERAAVTIRILGLNEGPRPRARMKESIKFVNALEQGPVPLFDYSYRFAMAFWV